MMDEQDVLRQLASRRKMVSRSNVNDLIDSDIIPDAIELASLDHPSACHLENLSLWVVILRSSALIFSQDATSATSLNDVIHQKIVAHLQPGGWLASALIADLGHPVKPIHQRAVEVMSFAGRLASVLPPAKESTSLHKNFMTPLLMDIIKSGTSTKMNLSAISALIEHVPAVSVPSTLLEDILDDMSSIECPGLRGAIAVDLLSKREKLSSRNDVQGREEDMIQPLIPYLDPESHAPGTLTHINRYILPLLFKQYPTSLKTLLRILDGSSRSPAEHESSRDTLAAWASVASIGVATGLLDIDGLSEQSLTDAVAHSDPEIRLRAFELVTSGKDLLRPGTVKRVKNCLKWNEVLPSSESRTDFASAFHTYSTRLRAADQTVAKLAKKFGETSSPQSETSQALHRSFLEDYVDPALRSIHRGTIVRIILGLTLFRMYIDIHGCAHPRLHVVTSERVHWLFSCQSSAYAEVRNRAREILEMLPLPLPGFESTSSPSVETLLKSAYESLGHKRNTQAEAGKATICIAFEKLVQSVDDEEHSRSIAFVDELLRRLEWCLEQSEANLVEGIVSHPLHGLLATVKDIAQCINLCSPGRQSTWKPTFKRITKLIDRVWIATRPVISLTATDPNNLDESEPASDVKGAEHEIARAIHALGSENDALEDEGAHTDLLSNCWRAMKESGELLAAIMVVPFNHREEPQALWTRADLSSAGDTFLTWLHEIRHRGTFSKIAPAFGDLVLVLRQRKEYRDLCETWLEGELEIIANDQISITRRSAAIPFSVLSIVSSDQELLDLSIDRLVALAEANGPASDTTKIHAFNTLKIVLLDARQTRLFSRFFEKVVMMALGAFTSANWNVRNVGLILFSTLVHRSLSSGRGQHSYSSRTALASRQTFAGWNDKYPKILPSITNILDEINQNKATCLRWSSQSVDLQHRLHEVVIPFLSSAEWQVREVVAQSLSSLLSPEEALRLSIQLLRGLVETGKSNDTKHGELLLIRRLFSDVVDWSDVAIDTQGALEKALISIIGLDVSTAGVIRQAVADCVSTYIDQSNTVSQALRSTALSAAAKAVLGSGTGMDSGADLMAMAMSRIMLRLDPAGSRLLLLTPHMSEDIVLAALDSVNDSNSTPQILDLVIQLVMSSNTSTAVRIKCLDIISGVIWKAGIIDFEPKRIREVASYVAGLLKLRCVPLREAALPVLAWAVAINPSYREGNELVVLAEMVHMSSHEDQSEPTRASALRALDHLTPIMFSKELLASSSTLMLHQSLLRLLQDDDEEIRQGAAIIVISGLNDGKHCRRPVVQARAVEMWWDWLRSVAHGHGLSGEWQNWLWDLAADESGMDVDLNGTSVSNQSEEEILFEVERSNLYRDPLIDAVFAANVLKECPANEGRRNDLIARRKRAASAVRNCLLVSPISHAWEAVKALEKRIEIIRVLEDWTECI